MLLFDRQPLRIRNVQITLRIRPLGRAYMHLMHIHAYSTLNAAKQLRQQQFAQPTASSTTATKATTATTATFMLLTICRLRESLLNFRFC